MTSESEHLSDLIGTIYDTTLDPSLWTEALAKTCAFTGGVSSTLAFHDTASATGNIAYEWGTDPHYTQHYVTALARTNPLMVSAHLQREPGEVFAASDLMPYDELQRSRVYLEWMKPQGWGDFTHFLIEKSGRRFGHFGVANKAEDSPAGAEARRRLRLLVPHVTRAVAIARTIELHKVEADTLSSVVDALSAAVILVTADRNVVYANPSAEAMLADGRILQQRHDGLIATEAAAMDELRAAIARCARGDLASDGDPVAIALGGADERLVAHVVSLARGARRQAGKLYGAVAGIFVHEAELRRPTLIQTVAKLYGLTPGETRVLFAMLEAGGVPQTAAALGVSDETVKSHLKHIFEKTDRSRQADLVKLIGEIANPMVG